MDYRSMKSFTPNGPNSLGSQSSPFPKMMLSRRRSSVSGPRKSAVNTHILIRDEMLLKLLSRAPDQPLRPNVKNFVNGEKSLSPFQDENTPPPAAEQRKPPDSCHRFEGKPLEKGTTPEYREMSSSPKTPIARGNCKTYPSMCLLQQELETQQCPDRSEDKSALKDSAKNNFTNNDEKSRIAKEKRTTTTLPKSIQEVMKDVVVYVEVRTGEDNRSAGVKKVISQLGAKVNDKLLRNTTHVVFKDGLLSTYNKAKKWNIPLVSILWIEECKKQMKLMDPILFPISNIGRYENPELYGRLKRIKSMQPDSEEKCRRNRSKTVKETEIEETAKTNSALVVPKKPKDKLNEILYEFHEKLLNTPDDNGDCLPFESKLLQRIKNSPFTPKSQEERNKTGIKDTLKGDGISEQREDCNNSVVPHARKSLKFGNSHKELSEPRLVAGALKPTKSEGDCVGSTSVTRRTTRRSSMSATSATPAKSNTKKDQNKSVRRTAVFTFGEEPSNQITPSQVQEPTSSKNYSLTPRSAKKSARRRTLFTPTANVELKATSGSSTRTIESYFPKENSKRQTTFNPIQTIEETIDSIEEETPTQLYVEDNTEELVDEEKGEGNFRKTSFNLLEEHASTFFFSSTRTPQMAKRKTLFDISMDILDKQLQNINKSAKQNKIRRDSIESEHSITPVNQLRTMNNERITDSSSQSELLKETPTEDLNKPLKSLSSEVSEQLPKKRKLFAPLDMASLPAVIKDFDASKYTAKKRKKIDEEASNANRKRRTLFVPGSLVEDSPIQQSKPDRRRTMGFDVMRKIASAHSGAKAELAVPFLV